MTPTSFDSPGPDGTLLPPGPALEGVAPAGGGTPAPVDDESAAEIDQYMRALLDRVKQQSTPVGGQPPAEDRRDAPEPSRSAAPAPATEPTIVPAIEPRPEPPAANGGQPAAEPSVPCPTPSTGVQRPEPTATPEEDLLSRRTPPPERSCDIAAMRQLANHSAQDAIATYARAQMLSRAYTKLTIAILATIASVLLFWMSLAGQSSTLASALLALLVAITWGAHHLILRWRAWFGRPRRPTTRNG